MEFELLGWPEDGPQLRLDHREFSYAGKFVMSNTGKAVVRESEATSGGGAPEDATESPEADSPHGESASGEDGETPDYADDVVAAVAFNEDRTDPATAWLRYVTVRTGRRGDGIGARLTAFAADRLESTGYDRVKIAVNNPFAYRALHKAGFGYTGEETGLAELVLARPGDRSPERYRAGLDAYRERDDLAPEERSFLDEQSGAGPPERIDPPSG
ncbi:MULTISPECIES: GNAT family N-acetyltransferase [Halorussus]|uniref:GNAT family N-acetyltransferase n=1 Tax=Halorussus TaxID=1070314 RepID=UPI00209D36BC|nr:GNAT family N-acetyltransferase [Halorussus vallis]USZ75926.1 GNAT family N-acetyltransferase [Halorussus vallis]